MEEYKLFYKDILLGSLTVDTVSGKHMYIPEKQGVTKVIDRVSLIKEIKEGTDGFVEPIPFFSNRLMNMKRWGLSEINYQTDWFLLKRV